MEEWEYCLLWASPRKTIVVKPGGQVETFSSSSLSGSSDGILVGLQSEGWQTVAFDSTPTIDMTYLFKRRARSRYVEAHPEPPSAFLPVVPQSPSTISPQH